MPAKTEQPIVPLSKGGPSRDTFGPTPLLFRGLRWLETSPDAYVRFASKQRQWAFSYRHPLLWCAYRVAAKARCWLRGHEYSACWEADKFVPDPLTRTNCLFCGKPISAPRQTVRVCDSGRLPKGEDAPAAECEASQSGAAKTAHRPKGVA